MAKRRKRGEELGLRIPFLDYYDPTKICHYNDIVRVENTNKSGCVYIYVGHTLTGLFPRDTKVTQVPGWKLKDGGITMNQETTNDLEIYQTITSQYSLFTVTSINRNSYSNIIETCSQEGLDTLTTDRRIHKRHMDEETDINLGQKKEYILLCL